ncbi:MAG: hypothetical protein IJU77_11000 [Butyrivibrio sp.]|nr:hypothetical protein [Butyrivibrio sp.]
MLIFVYTFAIVFIALVVILGLGGILAGIGERAELEAEGAATAAMCTTQLLGIVSENETLCDEDFVIEQDMVFTYDSLNL